MTNHIAFLLLDECKNHLCKLYIHCIINISTPTKTWGNWTLVFLQEYTVTVHFRENKSTRKWSGHEGSLIRSVTLLRAHWKWWRVAMSSVETRIYVGCTKPGDEMLRYLRQRWATCWDCNHVRNFIYHLLLSIKPTPSPLQVWIMST